MGALLMVSRLTAGYGNIAVLHDLDLHVNEGELIAVLGANGAGKSTLLKTILGLLPCMAGSIHYDGRDLGTMPVAQRIRRGMGAIPEGRKLFGDMTVTENLALGLYAQRPFRPPPPLSAMRNVFDLLPRLEERAQPAGSLSGGEAQMLAIGRALMSRPRLLLCDEPSLGLAPLRVAEMFATLDRIRGTGVTVVLADQNANAALRLADRAYVLESGKVLFTGPAPELIGDDRLIHAYVGTARGGTRHGVQSTEAL
jgi:branched-chain amino acid transport system ATP-binding protein